MKKDVLNWMDGKRTSKLVSKETINNRELIELVSGCDVYRETQDAFFRAYEALGIDVVIRVPLENAPEPTPPGETRPHPKLPYNWSYLGVYDSVMRHSYLCKDVEEVWQLSMDSINYDDLLFPSPHTCHADDIMKRDNALGEIGVYYPLLYTTLFMWAVETLGWEIFMYAATLQPQKFHDHFLLPCVEKSKALVREIAVASCSPLIFVHDDLSDQRGPIFPPGWYDDFIFPHYPEIFNEVRKLGKGVMFVCDGNSSQFLSRLYDLGVDGIMPESPATPLDSILEFYGSQDRLVLGGIDIRTLTTGTPDETKQMVYELAEKTADYPGFGIRCCGGLHGGIPLENLEAYFDARADIFATPKDWRVCRHK